MLCIGLVTNKLTNNVRADVDEKPRDSYSSDALAALCMSSAEDALVVTVSAGSTAQPPLQVLCVSSPGAGPALHCARLLLVLEQDAALRLKQSFVSAPHAGSPAPQLVLSNTRVVLRRGARLEHLYAQELDPAARHVEVLSAGVPAQALYSLTALQLGGRVSRLNAHVDLLEAGANCTLHGVSLPHTRQSLGLHTSITHAAPRTLSRQTQRNAVGDLGEAVFKGRIRIPRVAQGADSDQQCRTLMLGERARVVAMPTLEITADDITCSHGAAICDLDENAMYVARLILYSAAHCCTVLS